MATPAEIARCCKLASEIREKSFNRENFHKWNGRRCYDVSFEEAASQAIAECGLDDAWRGLVYMMISCGYADASDWWNHVLGANTDDLSSAA